MLLFISPVHAEESAGDQEGAEHVSFPVMMKDPDEGPNETDQGTPPVIVTIGDPIGVPGETDQGTPPVIVTIGDPDETPGETDQGTPPVIVTIGDPDETPGETDQGTPPVIVTIGDPNGVPGETDQGTLPVVITDDPDEGLHETSLVTGATGSGLTDGIPAGGEPVQEAPLPPDYGAGGEGTEAASSNPRLLIITPPEYIDELQPLKEWKDRTGIPTHIISLQTIYDWEPYNGYDAAEEVRRCIYSYETYYNTYYFMLVGDSDKFPVRYTLYNRANVPSANFCYMATDLYYADLYRGGMYYDWDENNDNYFGQLNGETITGTVNIDNIDMQYPDVAVGRVPASTGAEVTTYVNKVISYEANSYNSAWFKNALFITERADGAIPDNWCTIYQNAQTVDLAGFSIKKLYYSGNPCGMTTDPVTASNINTAINDGKGFVCYFDHGAIDGWSSYRIADVGGLANAARLPVVIGIACDTSHFVNGPPYHPYMDMSGTHHTGTDNGEVFFSIAPRPANTQVMVSDNPESFGEYITVKTPNGAIAYVGSMTGAQYFGGYLAEGFFEGYHASFGTPTLGNVWNYAIWHYYKDHPAPATINPVNWVTLAGVHQPWKYFLFGDPSLRIGGVSGFQKNDFAGTYQMNHDGWKGTLTLWAEDEDYIEGLPPIGGTYTGSDGKAHMVRGFIRTWQYPLDASWGPDYHINFTIDFYDTYASSDDQLFSGYLFTGEKDVIAGKTWWNSIPFGFYAIKGGTTAGSDAPLTEEELAFLEQILSKEDAPSEASPASLDELDFAGYYAMNHDGWLGTLHLQEAASPVYPTDPNLVGTYTRGTQTCNARAYVRSGTYPLPPSWGPDHRIDLYIDFAKTPSPSDDQKFEGYLFTQTKDAMAGVTWWNTAPFGFYAVKIDPLRVMAPNGGEAWHLGSTQTIRWTYAGDVGPTVKIEVLKGSTVLKTLAGIPVGSGGNGSFTLTVPSGTPLGTDYKVRITSSIHPAFTDTSDAPFSVSSPITVVTPNGGETWVQGSSQTISWNYIGTPGPTVTIEALKGTSVLAVIPNVPIGSGGSGSLPLTVPYNTLPDGDYRIRITSTTLSAVTDTSNAPFTIKSAITVVSPNGGETWKAGTVHPVTWTYTGNPGPAVKIEALWGSTVIGTIPSVPIGTTGSGSYPLTVPLKTPPGTEYRFRVTSTTYPGCSDTSNGAFTISAP